MVIQHLNHYHNNTIQSIIIRCVYMVTIFVIPIQSFQIETLDFPIYMNQVTKLICDVCNCLRNDRVTPHRHELHMHANFYPILIYKTPNQLSPLIGCSDASLHLFQKDCFTAVCLVQMNQYITRRFKDRDHNGETF